MKVFVVHGEVRKSKTKELEASASWEEVLVEIEEESINDGSLSDDEVGNALTARAAGVVNRFNSSLKPGEREREIIRTWVTEQEEAEDEGAGSWDDDGEEELE